ncbi:MAG: ATP-binding protein [Gammaproteobacteria bacterium]
MTYRPRLIEAKLKEYLNFFSVVGLTGPRQSGKSTLLLHCLPNYRYVNFDDYKMVDFFHEDPEKFMSVYHHQVIFDEIQKVPRLFDYIKIAVDQDRETTGKYVLTGSSQFQFIKGITESLAGRIGLLSLLPYQLAEIPAEEIENALYKGSYPELVNKKYTLSQDWYAAYIDTYLKKDVSALAQVGDKREFQKLIQLLAANTTQCLNLSTYAHDLGVDVKTIKRWISILEASYIIFLLPPYYQNFGKRIVKSPKIYFWDTGLVSYLTGIETYNQFIKGPLAGSLFENYIIADIYKRELHNKTHADLYYFRTSKGLEIDLIIDRKNRQEFIEIKLGGTFNIRWLKSMESLLPPNTAGILIYTGQPQPYTPGIEIVNYQTYLGRDLG